MATKGGTCMSYKYNKVKMPPESCFETRTDSKFIHKCEHKMFTTDIVY